jgi:hypothetical protein
MNFLTHGLLHLDEPLVVAGTAVPDWMSLVDRKIRPRRRFAAPFVSDLDKSLSAFARGIVQHHDDDQWFHQTRVFFETNLEFACQLRDLLPGDEGFRPSFVGHILIEILLDAIWIDEDSTWISRYYQALEQVDPQYVVWATERLVGKPVPRLADVVRGFVSSRFLYDYVQSDKLWRRLNQIMRRVALPPLPYTVSDWLPGARNIVSERRCELITPPDAVSPFPIVH